MERRPVSSSTIRSIGYDSTTLTLEIEFQARGTYRYFDVPEFLYSGLMVASSKGTFLNSRILGRYRQEEIR